MTDFKVRYSYLPQQFAEVDEIFEEMKRFIPTGDFTLGEPLREFEARFADLIGTRHAIGVGSGTDALKLPLKAIGVGHGDEVITAANTFIATVGAINEVGARTVFVDCDDTFCMDVSQVEAAITERTKAIMPVQFTGEITDMPKLMEIAERHGLPVVEDACQGILAAIDGKRAGTWGIAGGFSLHPLKNLNVWGDGGVVVTSDDEMAAQLRLLRNHGLKNRDEISLLGYNSRLDTLQAIVGNWLIGQTHDITQRRIDNAALYDAAFSEIPQIRVPHRRGNVKRVFHLYIVFAEARDELLAHCLANGIEAKVHYHAKTKDLVHDQIDMAKELAGDGFEVINHYHELAERFDKDYETCPFLQFLTVIGADGAVYTCQDKAYTASGKLGSIKDRSFRDFWFSEENKRHMRMLDPSKVCSHHCVAERKNRLLHEYLGTAPAHQAFV